MSFLIKKIGNKLWRNAGTYLFLVLEFALGVSFLIFARNASLSVKELQAYYNEHYTPTTISLSGTPVKLGTVHVPAITPLDVQAVQLQFPNEQLNYRMLQYLNFAQDGEVKSAYAFYRNEPEFEGKEPTVFLGKNVMAMLNNGKIQDLDNIYEISENALKLNGHRFAVAPLPKRLEGKKETVFPAITNAFFSMDDCIILPLKENLYIPSDSIAILDWDTARHTEVDAKLNELQEALFMAHNKNYTYITQYPMRIFEKSVADAFRLHTMAGKLGNLMFVELLIGFSGLMLLFLKKREKELAVCLAVGAKRCMLAIELICEIGIVCLLGVILGIAAGNAITVAANSAESMLQTNVHTSAAIPAAIAAVAVTLLSGASMLYKIYTVQPDGLLRGE